MNRWSKISLLLSGLALLILFSTRYLMDGWQNFMFVPLGLFVMGIVLAVAMDWRMFLEFFSMRTTKHGMNMGVMILLALVLIVAINFLGVRMNKTFDLTEEKINSLSQQSQDVLKSLNDDVVISVFYKGDEAQMDNSKNPSPETKARVKQTLEPFQETSPKVKVHFFNTYTENLKADEYLNNLPDKQRSQVFVFVEYDGKKARVESPFGEEQITSALIQSTKKSSKKIYFLQGHGERALDSDEGDGLKLFKQSLEQAAFIVEPLNLVEKGSIPADTSVLAIVGSISQLLDQELKEIREYAKKGGRLFIAVDPGQKHNLALLTKTFGIEYMNNFIINQKGIQGRSQASTLGLAYDPNDEITKRFEPGNTLTIFDLASEIRVAPDKAANMRVIELVKTDPTSFAINELKTKEVKNPVVKSMAIGVKVTGDLNPATTPAPDKPEMDKVTFEAIIFGDSDFVSNNAIQFGSNRDLALNSIASLANESVLVSIRPPMPKGTKVELTRSSALAFIFISFAIPILILISGSIFWFRRRSA